MFHYQSQKKDHFILVELKEERVDEVIKQCCHINSSESTPVTSSMFWFKAREKKNFSSSSGIQVPLFIAPEPLTNSELNGWFFSSTNLSEQMNVLYQSTRLDEIGIRLRFFTAMQIESALKGLFPNCSVIPFGSSVNGFGRINCDLDLVLNYAGETDSKENSRLVFQGKVWGRGNRIQTQRHMEHLADLMHLFLPGCTNVRRILQARVPIVKYYQQYTDIECDLTLSNMTGVYMSELLRLYVESDSRVAPLVFTVRHWAASVGLTSSSPGRWITNFSLSALVLFYLQTVNVIPSYKELSQLASEEDMRIFQDVNCTFVRDLTRLPEGNNKSSQEELLVGFFEFISKFDFSSLAASVYSGSSIVKPDYSPLYIVNPLERSLNVSKNVSLDEVERLKMESRNASWLLESKDKASTQGWGLSQLLGLSETPLHASQTSAIKTGKRMFVVKDLFSS